MHHFNCILIFKMSEPSLSRTKPFAPFRLKYLSTLRARVSTWSVGLSSCHVLNDFVGKSKGSDPREHGSSFKGQMRYRAEAHRPQRTKELLRSQTTFPRLCSVLKPSKKKHFVTKNRNYTMASELQTSPEGHSNDFRLSSAGADTFCHSGCCWLPKAQLKLWLSGGYNEICFFLTPIPAFLLQLTEVLLHKNQSSGRR